MIMEYIKTIEEGLIGENSIPAKLRNDRAFDRIQFQNVKRAIETAIQDYQHQDVVDKTLALCFVDISNHFFVDESFYSEEDISEIEDAGIALSELANRLFT